MIQSKNEDLMLLLVLVADKTLSNCFDVCNPYASSGSRAIAAIL